MTAGRLEASKRGTLPCPVHTNQSLEEETIRQFLGLRAQLAYSERLLERGLNLALVLLLHPNQRERRIAGLERPLRGLDDRAIHAITVREGACWGETEKCDRHCRPCHPRTLGNQDTPPQVVDLRAASGVP